MLGTRILNIKASRNKDFQLRGLTARLVRCAVSCVLVLLTTFSAAQAENRDEVIFFFNDALGSAVAAVNEIGELCWSENYTPYGDKTINDDVVATKGCGIVGEERGFTGHTEDVNSDLVYMHQRYYDPGIGRFLSVDPRDANPNDPVTYNRYAYANNNPYKYVDPDGRFPIMATIAVIGVGLTVYEAYSTYKNEGPIEAAKSAALGGALTVATGGSVKIGASIAKRGGKYLGRNDVTKGGVPKAGSTGGPGTGKAFPEKIKDAARQESNNTCVFCGTQTKRTKGPDPQRSHIDHAVPNRGMVTTLWITHRILAKPATLIKVLAQHRNIWIISTVVGVR